LRQQASHREEPESGMLIQTILNRIEKQPGFVYGAVRFVEVRHRPAVEVTLRPRRNRRGRCSRCRRPAPGYDTLAPRRFEFVPLWGVLVFFVYALRRVQCPRCGVRVEGVPWAEGKHQLTTTYAWFLARWAKRLSWTAVAASFHTSWTHVYRAVAMAVAWGRAHQDLTGVTAIGFDEIQWHRGHHYLTLVYQIDAGCRRLLWIGEGRTVKTALRFFRWFGRPRTQTLRFVCSDMWKPYLKVIAKKAPGARHILDRFHITAHLSKAIDQVRAAEARALKARGEPPLLSKTRWVLLRRPENLTGPQLPKLAQLLRYNLRTVRAYLLKEEFQLFWTYVYPTWAGRFLDRWCTQTRRSRLEPMKKVAAMLTGHRALLLNWFRAGGLISGGAVEGFNNHAKLTMRRSFGFRSFTVIELALFHTLGKLPEPTGTHTFS
jgi:transposase